MKILLFTHEQDIDGMGSIIIASQAFSSFDYITCQTFEVNQKVKETIDNGKIYDYDFIYVTDICIKEPLLKQISNDKRLKDKIIILDHHKSEIEEGNDKYPFVNIIVSNEKGKQSGTSLFYNYLITNNLLKPTSFLDELVELTRQYDTWEWKDIYKNPKARMLHILFEQQGYKEYLNQMIKAAETKTKVEFNSNQLAIIDNYEQNLSDEITKCLNEIKVYSLDILGVTYKIGFVKSLYKYRNDFEEAISKNNIYDIDAVGIIMLDKNTVSYRKIKNIDVSKIGAYFGGKGHKGAASNPQDNQKFIKVLSLIYK